MRDIAELPVRGAASFERAGGLRSRQMAEGGMGSLERRLDRTIDPEQAAHPPLAARAPAAARAPCTAHAPVNTRPQPAAASTSAAAYLRRTRSLTSQRLPAYACLHTPAYSLLPASLPAHACLRACVCVQAKRPYLGGAADEAIYGRKINNVARTPLPNEKTSVHDLYETLYDAVYRGSVRGYLVLGYPPPHPGLAVRPRTGEQSA